MEWMHWRQGRQGTGYWKLLIFRLFRIDCYLLQYPTDTEIPEHRDPVEKGRHFRLNIALKQPRKGGIFWCEKCIFHSSRVNLFRSDLYIHKVSRIEEGERWVLSIGLLG